MRVAVIGYGKQGQRLALKLYELGVLAAISDYDTAVMQKAKWDYSEGVLMLHPSASCIDARVDAIVIATPTSTHYEIAKLALEAGKDVLVEKPLTKDSGQATELVDIATALGRILMVGHNTLYHVGTEAYQSMVRRTAPMHYSSIRTNPDGFREDNNVLWRLLPHDIALSMYLFESVPKVRYGGGTHGTVAAGLSFKGGSTASLYGSWEVASRVREAWLYDVEGVGAKISEEGSDTLLLECEHFLHCIETREKPLTDGEFGLKVVRVLEEIERKLR